MVKKKRAKKLKAIPQLGRKYGRPDIERCDIFLDMGFPEWGRTQTKVEERSKLHGLSQMYSGIPSGGRKKCGLQKQAGYFEKEFISLYFNDPYLEKWKIGRTPERTRAGPWIPAHATELQSSPGDYYGTFTKNLEAFSPLTRPTADKRKPEPKNIVTNPPKKGNAGFVDICINKYPAHSLGGLVDSYPPGQQLYADNWKKHKEQILNGPFIASSYPRSLDPNPYKILSPGPEYVKPHGKVYGTRGPPFYPPATPKIPGNNHDGCFTKFPQWSPEPYRTFNDVKKLMQGAPPAQLQNVFWKPEPRIKRYYSVSVVSNKIDIACNERTWRTMKPITYPQFNL